MASYPPHDPRLPVVAVDFDGVLAEPTWPSPYLGKADPAALDLVRHYHHAGCQVVVFTARPVSHHDRIWRWLEDYDVYGCVYDVTNVKPVAGVYFDDRAYRWPLT